ncbi:hypothetical protein [Acinetobacter sp.]|uniref:hypothetical protein n=2 Tax=unclassified Acinetobacter TaxID=196816 RepID=UPI00289CDA1C|nr:hypothetical protein [Acinetobacter sp.]
MINFQKIDFTQIIFSLLIVLTVGITLSGSYLPMVDLPQHAAQVATLNDALKGESAWREIFDLNFSTPYLLGYFTWLLISQFFEVVLASRILVAFIFLLFVFSTIKLKDTLGATWLVPWIAIPSFFGFCYEWGFVTYLLSISIGILFFIENIKWSNKPTLKGALFVFVFGIFLFYSHILSYLFFCLLSFVFILYNLSNKKDVLKIIPVYALFFCFLLIYIYLGDELGSQYGYGVDVMYHTVSEKIINLMVFPWSILDKSVIYFSIIFLILPFLMGYSFSRDLKKIIPIFIFLLIWFALPHFINKTYFIYERYSILFFVFYYLLFDHKKEYFYSKYFKVLFFILVFYLMLEDYKNIFLAKKETTDFSEVIEVLPSEKRVLGLIFEPISSSVSIPFTYVHFASWYQAQKNGWSDFNFAWFHPQIVRYKPSKTPEVKPGFEWTPQHVQYLNACDNYDILIVRAYDISVRHLIEHSTCRNYTLSVHHGSWLIFEKNK